MRAHSHAFHEIIAPVRGKMHVEMKGRTLTAAAGELLVYQAGNAHQEWSDKKSPVDMYFVAFEHPGLDAPLPPKLRDARGRVALMISWLSREDRSASELQRSAALGLLEAVVAEMLRLTAEREVSPLVARTREFARAHLAESLALDDLADYAGMSKSHFARRFRAAAGCTPMRDLRLLRLEYAKNLILTTDLPLKAIAPLTGLGDEYHLSRLFRRHLGFTPGSLRIAPGR